MFVDERERRVCRLHELSVADADFLNSGSSLASLRDCLKKAGRKKSLAIFFGLFVSDGVSVMHGWMMYDVSPRKKMKSNILIRIPRNSHPLPPLLYFISPPLTHSLTYLLYSYEYRKINL